MIAKAQVWRATVWALLIALVGLGLSSQIVYRKQDETTRLLADSQQRQRVLAELAAAVTQTATAQRAAHTDPSSPSALRSYQGAHARAQQMLERYLGLHADSSALDAPAWRHSLQQLRSLVTTRLAELEAPMRSASTTGPGSTPGASQALSDGADADLDARIDAAVAQLGAAERKATDATSARVAGLRSLTLDLISAVLLVSIALVLGVAPWLRHSSARSAAAAAPPDSSGARRELGALLRQLQIATEEEKAQLARSLHDDLGGLLIAVKMDASWLHKRWPDPTPDIQARWERVLKALDEGVDFKRRVVEHLRPTLLDNMGLMAALRWVTHETCSHAGLACTESYPEQEPLLREEVSILAFRLVQEALANIVKHAHATDVRVEISSDDRWLKVLVEDNGVGIQRHRTRGPALHGLALMDLRIASLGGSLEVEPIARGTRLRAHLPLQGLPAGEHDRPEPAAPRCATVSR